MVLGPYLVAYNLKITLKLIFHSAFPQYIRFVGNKVFKRNTCWCEKIFDVNIRTTNYMRDLLNGHNNISGMYLMSLLLTQIAKSKITKSPWWLKRLRSKPTIVLEKSKSLDLVIRGRCNFKGGTFSQYITTLTSLVTIGIVINGIRCF